VRIAIQDIYPGHLGLAIHEHGWDSKLRDPVATYTARLGPGAGNHHYKPSYTDNVCVEPGKQSSVWTMSFSFDQDVGKHLGTFFRYAYAGED